MAKRIATYSIAACDLEAGQWGVAVQSKFLSVGSVVPWAEPGVGAIATQAYANPRYGPNGLALLREGKSAQEAVDELTAADDGREQRQLGIVDGKGQAATYTGGSATTGPGGARAMGTRPGKHPRLGGDRRRARGDLRGQRGKPLAERLLDCLAAAQAAGGDKRGQQSASLLIVERDGGYAQLSDIVVDLRVEDHERPIEELTRIYRLHQAIFGETPRDQWVQVDDTLAEELRERLAKLGYEGELGDAFLAGPGMRISRSALTESWPWTQSCSRSCAAADERLRSSAPRRARAAPGRRRRALSGGPRRRRIGVEAFGSNAWTGAKAGDRVVEEHKEEDGHEELYFVASGRATFTLGDEEIDAPPAPWSSRRREPSAERSPPSRHDRRRLRGQAGRTARDLGVGGHLRRLRVLETRRRGARAQGDRVCARAGHVAVALPRRVLREPDRQPDRGLEHLQRAVELDAKAREWAQGRPRSRLDP